MSSDDDSDDDEHDDNDDGEDDDESGGELGDVDYEFVNKTGKLLFLNSSSYSAPSPS